MQQPGGREPATGPRERRLCLIFEASQLTSRSTRILSWTATFGLFIPHSFSQEKSNLHNRVGRRVKQRPSVKPACGTDGDFMFQHTLCSQTVAIIPRTPPPCLPKGFSDSFRVFWLEFRSPFCLFIAEPRSSRPVFRINHSHSFLTRFHTSQRPPNVVSLANLFLCFDLLFF